MLYPDADALADADAGADDGPADTGPLDTAEAGSEAAALPFRRGPPGAFGSLT
jgi:hypothetical protein